MTAPQNPRVTQADIDAAALQWCGEKERETSLDDIRYFQTNWEALPGLCSRVEAFARHRQAAEAASKAREAEYHRHLTDLCAEVYAGQGQDAFLAAMEFLATQNKAALTKEPDA